MKYLFLITLSFLMASSLSAQEFELIKEDDNKMKQQRQEWFKEMRKAPDGINPDILDYEVRKYNFERRQEKLKSLLNKGFTKKDILQNEVVADGLLEGKWIERGSNNQSGRIHTADIDFSRNLIYAASSGGNIWRGTIEGEDWTCLNNTMKFVDIKMVRVVNTGDANRIIVVHNSPAGVKYSDDEGLTWQSASGIDNVRNSGTNWDGVVDAEGNVYILSRLWGGNNKIMVFRSTDYAENFEKVFEQPKNTNFYDLYAPRVDDSNVYMIHDNNISKFAAEDGEIELITSSQTIADNLGSHGSCILSGSVVDGEIILGAAFKYNGEKKTNFFKSEEGGINWQKLNSVPEYAFMSNSFAMSHYSDYGMFFGGVEFYSSIDGGLEWERFNKWYDYYGDPVNLLHADIPGINVIPHDYEEIILISTDGGLYISYDYLISVENLSLDGLNVGQYYSSYTDEDDPDLVHIGAQDQGYQLSYDQTSDGIFICDQLISGDYGHMSSSDRGSTVWCVYPGHIRVYKEHGLSYTWIRESFVGSSRDRVWMPPVVAHPDYPHIAYLASGGSVENTSKIWKLTLNGNALTMQESKYNFNENDNNENSSAVAVSPHQTNWVYAMSTRGGFYTSNDNGLNFERHEVIQGPKPHYLYGNSILPSKLYFGHLYIAGSGYDGNGVFFSDDNGIEFENITDGLPNTMVYKLDMTADEKYIFAATQVGPYVYSVDQKKWFNMAGLDSPDQTYWWVEYIEDINTVRFSTYGRGVWDFKIERIASVAEDSKPLAANNIEVYPNPATDYANISFTIDSPTYLRAVIYNQQGHIVKDLYDQFAEPGEQHFRWNCKNFLDSDIPSGVYYLIVTADGISKHKVINIVR